MFADTVGYRKPLRERCPRCDTRAAGVRWRGLAAATPPDGHCPGCGHPIGPPLGAVELPTAAVLALLTSYAPSVWVLAAWAWVGLLGVAPALIDTTVHRLPDTLTIAAGLGTAGLLGAAAATDAHRPLLRALIGALGLGLAYLVAVLSTHAGMGRGDAQLAAIALTT